MWLEDNCELIGFFDRQMGPFQQDSIFGKREAKGDVIVYIEHGNVLKRCLQLAKRKLLNGIGMVWEKVVGSRRNP